MQYSAFSVLAFFPKQKAQKDKMKKFNNDLLKQKGKEGKAARKNKNHRKLGTLSL